MAFTLGFTESYALRRLAKMRADGKDYVIVFTIEPVVGAAKEAFNALKTMAAKMGVVNVEMEPLPQGDLSKAISKALFKLRVFAQSGYTPVHVDVTGGSRYIVSALVIATLMLRGFERYLWIASDTGEDWDTHINLSEFDKIYCNPLRKEHERILHYLASKGKGATTREIAEALSLSEKTVKNRVSELKKLGLCAQPGRGEEVTITPWGEAVLISQLTRPRTPR